MHVCFLILSTKSYKIRQIRGAFEETKRFFNKNFLAVYVRAFKEKTQQRCFEKD